MTNEQGRNSTPAGERVVVIGASANSQRYSNKAVAELLAAGYDVVPVHPSRLPVHGIETLAAIEEVPQPIHTVTMYVGERRAEPLNDAIIAAAPQRIIFNPGAENQALESAAATAGIETVQACTLVMLSMGAF